VRKTTQRRFLPFFTENSRILVEKKAFVLSEKRVFDFQEKRSFYPRK